MLQTGIADFPVPRPIDGWLHVVLLDGGVLGHWRAVTTRQGVKVDTRIEPLDCAVGPEQVERQGLARRR